MYKGRETRLSRDTQFTPYNVSTTNILTLHCSFYLRECFFTLFDTKEAAMQG